MSLLDTIKADQLAARNSKDTVAASLLPTLISEASKITDDRVITTIKKFLKSVENARDILAGSPDALSAKAVINLNREIVILNGYLPQQLDEARLRLTKG